MRKFEAGNRLRALGGGLRRDALAQQRRSTDPDDSARIPRSPARSRSRGRNSDPDRGNAPFGVHPDRADRLEPSGGRGGRRTAVLGRARRRQPRTFWGIASAAGGDAAPRRRLSGDACGRSGRMRSGSPTRRSAISCCSASSIAVFPNATLIHCRRHPIDTALSIFTTNFERNFDFAVGAGRPRVLLRQYQRLMAHWREVLPAGPVHRGGL